MQDTLRPGQRGTGYRPNTDEQRALDEMVGNRTISARMLAAPPAPPRLRALLSPVMDQGFTGSCTGHAFSGATYAAVRAARLYSGGAAMPFVPSQRAIYAEERCVELVTRGRKGDPLEDIGARPADGLLVLQSFGVRPMGHIPLDGRFSDVSEENVNDPPLLGDVESTTLLLGAHPITTRGEQLVRDLKTALAPGNDAPVALAVPGGAEAWQSAGAAVLGAEDFSGERLDHYVFLYHWEPANLMGGQDVWTLRNSWGEGWGLGGDVRVTTDFLERYTSDRYAMQVRAT